MGLSNVGRSRSGASAVAGFVLLAAAGVAGLAAAMYAAVVAYLAGSQAQAAIDGCSPAQPIDLARASMASLGAQVGGKDSGEGIIQVTDSQVEVGDAPDHAAPDAIIIEPFVSSSTSAEADAKGQ